MGQTSSIVNNNEDDDITDNNNNNISRLNNISDIIISSTTNISLTTIHCSMKNCYGLHLLYEFISIPYLMKRRHVIEYKLKLLNDDIKAEQCYMDHYQLKNSIEINS